ncbi:hypothetical protein LTR59_018317, partial [Friedmanniomyces endolithicus]
MRAASSLWRLIRPNSAHLIIVVARCSAQYAEALVAKQTLRKANCMVQDSHELDSDSSAPPTHGEPTVDMAAESECEDFLNDIVNGDVTPVRYDPAFAATPNTLKRKRDSSDRSELGKR